jgi:hypothetical protein
MSLAPVQRGSFTMRTSISDLTDRPESLVANPASASRPPSANYSAPNRIFLISPANASGVRARLILGDSARTELAQRLREKGAPLGEIFSFISGLYFRGKLTYARAYANPPSGAEGIFIITASGGLISPDKVFTPRELREVVAGMVHEKHAPYREPLVRDARLLRTLMGHHCEAVLLGSVATPKYVEPLLGIFGERLVFPAEFVGRGDMSRGAMLLRCAREARELEYIPIAGAVRVGRRPPKLPRASRPGILRMPKIKAT